MARGFVTFAALGTLAAVGAAKADIVANGGFETGTLSSWTVSGGSPAITTEAHSGAFALLIGAGSVINPNTIQQAITLTDGQSYHLEMWVKNYGLGSDQLFTSSYGSTLIDFTDPVPLPLEDWSLVTADFVANGANPDHTLRISAFDNAGSLLIDDISITPAPAPGAAAAGLAAAGVLLARRRRSS